MSPELPVMSNRRVMIKDVRSRHRRMPRPRRPLAGYLDLRRRTASVVSTASCHFKPPPPVQKTSFDRSAGSNPQASGNFPRQLKSISTHRPAERRTNAVEGTGRPFPQARSPHGALDDLARDDTRGRTDAGTDHPWRDRCRSGAVRAAGSWRFDSFPGPPADAIDGRTLPRRSMRRRMTTTNAVAFRSGTAPVSAHDRKLGERCRRHRQHFSPALPSHHRPR